MQNTFDLTLPEQGILEQILADLEVRASEELAVMKANGDRIIAEALAQKIPLAIIHKRIGNREKLEAFLRHSQSIRQIPAVRRCVMQTKISGDFVGELELRITDNSPGEAEAAFRNAVSAAAPFFGDIVTAEVEGCHIIRAAAELFELVPLTESVGADR